MGVDLAFQVQHGHFLLHQLPPEDFRVLQRQVEGQSHQGHAHAADKPGGVEGLQQAHQNLNGQGAADGDPLPGVELLPAAKQNPGAHQQVEGHRPIAAHHHMDAVGVVSLGRDGIVNREQGCPQLRHSQKDHRRPFKGSALPCLLLHQNGDVLVEQIHHQHHTADEDPVQPIVDKPRNRVQVVDGVHRGAVEDQVDKQHGEKCPEGAVQGRKPPLRREIDIGHKGKHQKQGNLHPKHRHSSSFTTILPHPPPHG